MCDLDDDEESDEFEDDWLNQIDAQSAAEAKVPVRELAASPPIERVHLGGCKVSEAKLPLFQNYLLLLPRCQIHLQISLGHWAAFSATTSRSPAACRLGCWR